MTEHKDFCGSRTDPCPLCSRYIFFRDKARHEESVCQYPEVKPAKPNPVKTSLLSSLSTNPRQTNPFGIRSLDSTEALHQQQELFDQFPGARNRGPLAAGRGGNARDMRRAFSEETDGDRKHRKNHDRVQNMMAKNRARSIEKNGTMFASCVGLVFCLNALVDLHGEFSARFILHKEKCFRMCEE